MATILILYSTTDGHTIRICERIRSVVEQDGHQAELHPIDAASTLDLSTFDTLLIGASIRYGKHQKQVYDFIAGNLETLEDKPSAFFSVNLVARKPGKERPDKNPYVRKFLRQIDWRPDRVAIFAGKLDYPRYRFFDRWMIRLIMLITHGPTDPTAVIEFTDWNRVEAFAAEIGEMTKT
jgi:menaquinone-dependent protoporphyrinogen oxidase